MREYLVTLLLAAALCYIITPLVRKWALHFGAVAQIRKRDIHVVPTPRWGGLAMWLSMSATFLIVGNLELVGKSFGRDAQGIFLAGTFLVLLGMLDYQVGWSSLSSRNLVALRYSNPVVAN